MRGVADAAEEFGDGLLRVTMTQNLLIAYVPLANLKRLHAKLTAIGLAAAGANTIDDVMTCPGAYSCNLALTKSMNLGEALSIELKKQTDPGDLANSRVHERMSQPAAASIGPAISDSTAMPARSTARKSPTI